MMINREGIKQMKKGIGLKFTSVCIIFALIFMIAMPAAVSAEESYKTWKQSDARWGSIEIANSSYQLKTVGQIGCAMTSLAILLVHSGACPDDASKFNPGIFAESTKARGGFTEDGSIYWAVGASYSDNFSYVTQVNLRGYTKDQKIIKMRELINDGYFLEVAVNNEGHWVAIDNVIGNTVKMMDPARTATDLFATYNDSGIVRIVCFKGGTNSYRESYKDWKQNDPRWSSISMGTDEYDTTIGSVGCAATSFAILLAHSGVCDGDDVLNFNPGIFVEWVKEHGGFTQAGDIYWTKGELYSDEFEYEGQIHLEGLTKQEKISIIKSLTDRNYLVEVSVNNNGHFVAVDTADAEKVTIMDPAREVNDLFAYYNPESVLRLICFKGPKTIPGYDYRTLSDCEDSSLWSNSFNTTSGQWESTVTEGEYSLKIMPSESNDNPERISAKVTSELTASINISNFEKICYDIYLNRSFSELSSIVIEIRNSEGDCFQFSKPTAALKEGWNSLSFNIAEEVSDLSQLRDVVSVSFLWKNFAGATGVYYIIDNIRAERSCEFAISRTSKLIQNIPETVRRSDKASVELAREAYEELSNTEVEKIQEIERLIAAEERLNKLFSVEFGDLDSNGKITSGDALIALQGAIGKITLTENQVLAGDTDYDDNITSGDALKILQYAVKKISKFE